MQSTSASSLGTSYGWYGVAERGRAVRVCLSQVVEGAKRMSASSTSPSPSLTPRPTQDASLDTFRLDYLIPPVCLLALIFNYEYSPFELVWSFSIWLESVAILPQLFMLQRTGQAEAITTHYLAALGLYRGLYIPNWIYRCVVMRLRLGRR